MGVTPTSDPGALLDRLEEARKAVAETLGRHRWISRRPGGVGCQCGWLGTRPEVQAHLADVALAVPEVAGLIRLARDGLALETGPLVRALDQAIDRYEALRAGVERLAENWTRYPQSPQDRERNRYGAAMEDCAKAIRAVVADTSGERQ